MMRRRRSASRCSLLALALPPAHAAQRHSAAPARGPDTPGRLRHRARRRAVDRVLARQGADHRRGRASRWPDFAAAVERHPGGGLTPEAAARGDRRRRDAATSRIRPSTVIVKQINSRKVFITGEVEKPGTYPLVGPTTVLQLVAMAGGLKEFADAKRDPDHAH